MNEIAAAPRVIGRNIARLRRLKGWTQAELAEEIASALGRAPWTRQAMSVAEQGQRGWTASEIVAVASLFGVTPGSLFENKGCATCAGSPPEGFVCKACGSDRAAQDEAEQL